MNISISITEWYLDSVFNFIFNNFEDICNKLEYVRFFLLYFVAGILCFLLFILFIYLGLICFRPGINEFESDENKESDEEKESHEDNDPKKKKKNKGKEKASEYNTGGGDNPGGCSGGGSWPGPLDLLIYTLGKRKRKSEKKDDDSKKKSKSDHDNTGESWSSDKNPHWDYEPGESSRSQNNPQWGYDPSDPANSQNNPQWSYNPHEPSNSKNNYQYGPVRGESSKSQNTIDPYWGERPIQDLMNYRYIHKGQSIVFISNGTIVEVPTVVHESFNGPTYHLICIGESSDVEYKNMMNFRAYGYGKSILNDCKINGKWDITKISERIEQDYVAKRNIISKIDMEVIQNRSLRDRSVSSGLIAQTLKELEKGRKQQLDMLKTLEKDNEEK